MVPEHLVSSSTKSPDMSRINYSKGRYTLVGKTVAISGATGGLGQELCRRFCELGASLILLDRNRERSCGLIGQLKSDFPELDAEHITVDLEDIEAVERAADELCLREVDYLVLNAGAYSIPRHKCTTGYDNVFQINFVSPYYLAKRLLPGISQRGGRIVAVGSIAHNYSKTDANDVDFSNRHAASKVYGNAKRYLMFSLFGESEYGQSVVVSHPGIAVTNITAHYPKVIYALIKYPMKLIFMSAKKASLCILCALFETCGENEWIGPRVFDVWGKPRIKRLKTCKENEAKQIRITADRIYREIISFLGEAKNDKS